jgi:hypothetical protein
MANLSTTLIPSTTIHSTPNGVTIKFPYVSDKVKGTGWAGNSNGLHTMIYATTGGWNGLLKIQATLATDPVETDWFDVDGTSYGNGVTPMPNQTLTQNFTGNFVWVRAVIVTMSAGEINRVQYTHN